MSALLKDLLAEGPVFAVLRARAALAEEKYERAAKEIASYAQRFAAIERENEELRAQILGEPTSGLGADAGRVVVHLFKAGDQDVEGMLKALAMERNRVQYHVEQLLKAGLVAIVRGKYLHGPVHWALTAEGRRRAVEGKLV